VHPLVRRTVSAYLAALNAEAPGLVEGLYLVGSGALGDFRPGVSDIDYVRSWPRSGALGSHGHGLEVG
jgi:hypothetical protein